MNYSFVLLAYNEENTIVQCIESILRQISLGTSYEIIVVDDGSYDKTAALVQDLARANKRIKLVGDGKNHGRGYGRYTGVNASAGKYVVMVDADIVLPQDWLVTTLPYMKDNDVAGGIAVPDGDVAYVYRRFKLRPKTVMGTTTVTGNNGMYKRSVFGKLTFDKHLREGEDVDFNNRAINLGVRECCVPGLTVEHQEHKSFPRSMLWLYQSGVGATRQLMRFKAVRLPDLAFAATVGSLIVAVAINIITGNVFLYAVPLLGVFGASLLHLRGKFYLSLNHGLRSAGALCTYALLIVCYYIGRLSGIAVYAKNNLTKSGGDAR